MNAKSRIFWEIPRNTLIWAKSAEIGVNDVKYIYFPYISGPKCWRQSVFGRNITLKIFITLGDAQENPNLAKISRKGVIDVKYIYFPHLTGPKGWRQSVFGQNITLKS